jgi:hypothetical protein
LRQKETIKQFRISVGFALKRAADNIPRDICIARYLIYVLGQQIPPEELR